MTLTVGIDEVGRGCWAGPLVAAAVLLQKPIIGLNDSKLLSKKRRQKLSLEIKATSYYGLGWVSSAEVDQLGLTHAVATAMSRALQLIPLPYDEIIIDGNYNFIPLNPLVKTLVKADLLVPAVSSASILAKVARDDYMVQQSKLFPGYGFDCHVGYGTRTHVKALKSLGICELHRRSYKPIKALLP